MGWQVYECLMEKAKEDGVRDFLEVSSDRTGDNGHKLKSRKSCVKTKPCYPKVDWTWGQAV